MKYFFVLGKNKALSMAEIIAVLPEAVKGELYNSQLFVVETKKILDAENLIKRLGGTIKIGKLVGEAKMYSAKMIELIGDMLDPGEGKFKYGISNYSKFASPKKDKVLAMNIKKVLREEEISCRWVTSKDKVLSSVVVGQNLLKNGIEIVLLGDYKNCLVGKTLAVQDYKGLSKRDYGRPERDDMSGMLPPKLAQMMINLSGAKLGQSILDPFCGSGTVLSEAMLMGYRDLLGTDKSEKAIVDSRANTTWIKKKYELRDIELELFEADARDLLDELDLSSIDNIVTEPYLGPQRGYVDSVSTQRELSKLYSEVIRVLYKLLAKGGRLVMVWPVRVNKEKHIFVDPSIGKFAKVEYLNNEQKKKLNNFYSKRGNLLYGRQGQKVWREIVVLGKS